MILRNDLYTFTADAENVIAKPVYNTNSVVTIGGRLKTQTDSKRLKINSQIVIAQSDLPDLELIIDNYTLPMYYTPNCKLYNRQTIEEIEVVMTNDPKIDQRIYYSDKVFYITFEFEEILSE
jgi:hypothetical protein